MIKLGARRLFQATQARCKYFPNLGDHVVARGEIPLEVIKLVSESLQVSSLLMLVLGEIDTCQAQTTRRLLEACAMPDQEVVLVCSTFGDMWSSQQSGSIFVLPAGGAYSASILGSCFLRSRRNRRVILVSQYAEKHLGIEHAMGLNLSECSNVISVPEALDVDCLGNPVVFEEWRRRICSFVNSGLYFVFPRP